MTVVHFRLALGVEIPEVPPADRQAVAQRCMRVADCWSELERSGVILDFHNFVDLLTHLESIEQTVRRARASHCGKDPG